MSKKIQITISGPIRSGKTYIAALITDALLRAKVNKVVIYDDTNVESMRKRIDNIKGEDFNLPQLLNDELEVEIVSQQHNHRPELKSSTFITNNKIDVSDVNIDGE
jgi:uridine kinase